MKPKPESTTTTRPDIAAKGRVALYARFSPRPKGAVGENYTIAAQLEAMRDLAATKYPDAACDEFIDRDISGESLDRPGLDQLRDAVGRRIYDAVLAYSPDRLTREEVGSVILLNEFKKHGTRLEFVSGSYEDTPEGRFSFRVQSLVSEFEREKIKDRSRRGRKEKAREGFHHSGPGPFGYRYLGHKYNQRGALEIIPEQAAIAKRIFEMTARGMSNYRVAMTLNAEGIPTAKGLRWFRQSIAEVLEKTVYYGLKPGPAGIMVPAPPIVPRELWDEAHAALARNRVALVGRPTRRYLLTGVLWCGKCGARYTTQPKRGDEAFYHCAARDHIRNKRLCHASGIRKSILEPAVWDAIWETLTDEALLQSVIEAYHNRMAAKPDGKKHAALVRIDRARRLVSRAEAIFRDPDQPIPYQQAKRDLEAARRELLEAETARPADVMEMPARSSITALAREFGRAYQELTEADFDERRGAVQRVVEKIRYEAGQVEITCRIPLEPQKNCNRDAHANCNTFESYPFVINKRVAA